LRRALRFVDGNFNTPCPAFWLGIVGSDDDAIVVSIRFTVDVGVPVSEDENDDEGGVEIRAPGEYRGGPGMDKGGGGACLLFDDANSGKAVRSCTRRNESNACCR